jgi:ABC-type spermidine/putrescine transport system permease subunit I
MTIEVVHPLEVILPLCMPAMGVTAVFTFIWTWNDFVTPLLYLNTPELYTVPLGLSLFKDSTGLTDYGALFAMPVLSLIPVFVVFPAGPEGTCGKHRNHRAEVAGAAQCLVRGFLQAQA